MTNPVNVRGQRTSQSGPQERRTLMAAYATVPTDDPFAVSKAMFGALAAGLAGPAAAGLTACELEELLDEECRKVVRQLLQDHYDLRAVREEQQARERRAPAAGTDGITRTRLETGHGRAAGHAVRHGDGDPVRLAETGSARITARPTPPCPCRPGGTPIPWRSWPRSRRPAAPSTTRTPRSPAAAGRSSASGRSRSPSCMPPPASPRSTPPGSRSRARHRHWWSSRPTARLSPASADVSLTSGTSVPACPDGG